MSYPRHKFYRARRGCFWYCEVCGAENHEDCGECQYCECGGLLCVRLNCSGDWCHGFGNLREIGEAAIYGAGLLATALRPHDDDIKF